MKITILLFLFGLGLVAGENLDETLIKRLIDALENRGSLKERETENRDVSRGRVVDKRHLYGATWNAKTQMVNLYPQRTTTCRKTDACYFKLTIYDKQGKVLAACPEFRWKNSDLDGAMQIRVDKILDGTLCRGDKNDKDDGKFGLGTDDDNAIKPDTEEIVCKLCRLVDRRSDRWTCNKRTLDLTKSKDSNFWGN